MKGNLNGNMLSIFFGIFFLFIGFVNNFWGNDPYFGFCIILTSLIYFDKVLIKLNQAISTKTVNMIKIVVGFLILWLALGVGEFFDKLALMIINFPLTFITGF